MDGASYEPYFDGFAQGVVIGDNATVINNFQSVPSAASYRSILGTPPPLTNPSSVQQRTAPGRADFTAGVASEDRL